MKLPYRPKSLPPSERRFSAIIIHDVSCQYEDLVEFMKDTPKFQVGRMRSMSFVLDGEYDVNYHFIVEKINDDYEAIVGRPLFAKCIYPDIPDMYMYSIHVAAMGDFDADNPEDRLYQALAYKVIIPMMRLFRISPNRVVLHRDVSTDETIGCPGKFFRKNLLDSYIKSWKISK